MESRSRSNLSTAEFGRALGIPLIRGGGSLPYTIRKGVVLVADWKEVLYQYSAHGRNLAHVGGLELAKQRKFQYND